MIQVLYYIFIGILIGYLIGIFDPRAKRNSADGIITVEEKDNKIVWHVAYKGDPYELPETDTVIFKVEVADK